MPYYTCSNAACGFAGQVFSLTGAGQTFCPHCFTAGALRAAATPTEPPTTRIRVLTASNPMQKPSKKVAAEVLLLIDKWDLNLVSTDEARKTSDHLFTLGSDAKRIDREGPVTNGNRVVTHGKFRLQFGHSTHAGVHIQVDVTLDAERIKAAFRESMNAGYYVEVYLA